MDRAIERALRGCGDGEAVAAPGLLDRVRRQMFGLAPPATSLGRYRLFEVVGVGGGGVVVRAEDPQLGREVAIKLVHAKACDGDDAARRLLREARALARLSHPDIVTIYDVGRVDGDRDVALERLVGTSVDGSVYLVMQWLDGGDLSQWLAQRERSWTEIVDAFAAAGRGLAAAHAAGLLHRDFKPANVLRDRAGRPHVADFGLGRVEQSRTGDDHDAVLDGRTRSDVVVGTPMYMSPEQHLGEPIDPRSDQYSFCFALREALYGPIAFASLTELVRAKLYGLPHAEAKGLPRSIARIIARGLARDPARRWPSMNALLGALARARRPRRRGPLVLGLGGLVLLGAALGPRATPAAERRDEPTALADELPHPQRAGVDWPSTRIDALLAAGRVAEAERELVRAVHEAEANDDTATMVHASARLIATVGAQLRRPDLAERWARHAFAALARVDDDGLLAAELHESLGMSAHVNGQWQRALDHFEESTRLVAAVRPDDELRRATLLARAAGARVQLGQYGEAIAGFEAAIATQRALLGDAHPGLAMTRHNFAIALSITGDVDRARDEATRALDAWLVAYPGHHPDIALGHQTLASICRNTGDLAGAITHASEAVRSRNALVGPDHPDTLTAELALATIYNSAGRLVEAQDLFAHVVAAHEADTTLTPNGGIAWLNLGDVQRRRGDLASARASLVRAHELLVASHGPRHLAVAMALLNLGVVTKDEGRPADAIAIFDECEAALRDAVGARHPRLASLWHERGRASAALGHRAAARADYDRALALLDGVPHVDDERSSIAASRAALGRSR